MAEIGQGCCLWAAHDHRPGSSKLQRGVCACHSAPGSLFYETVPTNLSVLHLRSQLPWDHRVGVRKDRDNGCSAPATSVPWTLCRGLVLHSQDQDTVPVLMLVPPPRRPVPCISICWNPSHTSLSLSHTPQSSEMLYLIPHVGVSQPKQMLHHLCLNVYTHHDHLLSYTADRAIFLHLQLDCICWQQDLYWVCLCTIRMTCEVLHRRDIQ